MGSVYNYFLLRRASGLGTGKRAAVSQALVDLVLLTVVLWAAGGISSPFIGFYVFHIALIGILGGPGATLVATAAALASCRRATLFPCLYFFAAQFTTLFSRRIFSRRRMSAAILSHMSYSETNLKLKIPREIDLLNLLSGVT